MKVEILAPAGNIDSAYKAFSSGSDAIYLAGPLYGARAYANNFSLEEIKEIIDYAHIYNKKVYITVNTLIFEDEMSGVIEFIDFLYLNGADAVIVQDLGLASIIHKRYPDLAIHASTQMNVHSVSEAKALKMLGYKRIVLAREVQVETIKEIKEKVDIELEVFVHGALCISYSGNCYFSSIVGKRSGNRGRCAQPCRLPYHFDSKNKKEKYYLSPKDLCTIKNIQSIVATNVDSLKIEGRMKKSEYVASVVKSYKNAIYNKNIDFDKEINDLKLAYNRGFTKGYILNETNNDIINLESQNHQGIFIGKIISTYKDKATIKLTYPLSFNDSIRIVGKSEDGIIINQMYVNNKLVKEAYENDEVTIKVHKNDLLGSKVYLTSSNKSTNDSIEKIKIDGKCYLEDKKIVLEVTDGENVLKEKGEEEITFSEKDFSERIIEQLKKTTDTPYVFENISISLPPIMIKIKEINSIRRKALENLSLKRINKYPNRKIVLSKDDDLEKTIQSESMITIKVTNEEQLQVALKEDIKCIYIEDYKLYKKYQNNLNVHYKEPRINPLNKEKKSLVSSIASTNGNFTSIYMNVVNSYSMANLLRGGALSIGLSLELDKERMEKMIKEFFKKYHFLPDLEVMVYGYYELMISKYCPIQKEYNIESKNCNKCLEKGGHYLIDRMGYSFLVTKGEGCYTKILNSKRVHLIKYLKYLKELGINKFLLDFSIEEKEEVELIIKLYKSAFNGIIINERLDNVTYGHFNEGVL